MRGRLQRDCDKGNEDSENSEEYEEGREQGAGGGMVRGEAG